MHPTILGKKSIPSALTREYLAIAATYVTFGFAILISDLPGFDALSYNPQPYILFPAANLCPIIDLLEA